MTIKRQTPIPEIKTEVVSELTSLIKDKKTVLIVSIKGIPSSRYQEISKKLRGKAIVKVPKKSLIFRALDSSGDEAVKKLKEQIKDGSAVLFSDLDAFSLAAELMTSKTPSKAKPGQEAPMDIEIPAGPTELVPGPAISELGALGIQIQIEKGKIHIKEPKVVVREGDKISRAAADIMNKLNIRPFSVGFVPLAAFDTKESKLYLEIKIDKENTLKELKSAFSKALPFAVEINYISKDTIKFLIGKAGMYSKALEKITETESTENPDEKTEEVKDTQEEKKEEEKTENSEEKVEEIKESNEIKSQDNESSEDIQNKSEEV